MRAIHSDFDIALNSAITIRFVADDGLRNLNRTACQQTKSSKGQKSLEVLLAAFDESGQPLEIAEFEDIEFSNVLAEALTKTPKSVK